MSTPVIPFPVPVDDDLGHVVARNVRAEMARRDISQATMATRLGISQQAMSDRLRGRVALTVADMGKLAALLGVSPASLCSLGDTGPEPVVRHQGLEPRTRWLMSAHPGATIVDLSARREEKAS